MILNGRTDTDEFYQGAKRRAPRVAEPRVISPRPDGTKEEREAWMRWKQAAQRGGRKKSA